MKKRVLVILFAGIFVLSLRAETICVNRLYYSLKNGDDLHAVLVMRQDENLSGDVVVPAFVEYEGVTYPVTEIAEGVFDGSLVSSVTLPEGLVRIGNSCYRGCANLVRTNVPSTVKSIGSLAFSGTGLTSLIIPEGVEQIGEQAFVDNPSLSSLTIPRGIVKLKNAFWGCPLLKTVGPIGGGYNIEFGWTESIPRYAFSGSEIEAVTLPDGMKSIEEGAFCQCKKLKSCFIPESVTQIRQEAFQECYRLLQITLPSNLVSIEPRLFCECYDLAEIKLPSVKRIGHGAFYDSGLTSLDLPESVTEIDTAAFFGCYNLTSINIPEGVSVIRHATFYECYELRSVNLPSSIKTIEDEAFLACKKLASVNIPNGVTRIGSNAFGGCAGMISLTIPESVVSIGEWAFWASCLNSIVVDAKNVVYDSRDNCNALIETASNTLIVGCQNTFIPNGVETIGELAFANCKIISIDIPGSISRIGENAFNSCEQLTTVNIAEGTTSIESGAFYYCRNLTSIHLPSSLRHLGNGAFSKCHKLSSISLPEGIERIEEYTFSSCFNLTSIIIPSSVKAIEEWAFENCESLEFISIPEGVESVGFEVFFRCPLKSIILPSSLIRMENYVFLDCKNLDFVTCNATVPPQIEVRTFPRYGTLRVPAGCREAYAAADFWKNFEIIEDVAGVPLGNSIYEGPIDREYDNSFVFSLQDSVLSINGYYTGNPDVKTSIEYTIVGHDIYLNMRSELDEERNNVVDMQPLTLDVAIEGCTEDYYFIYLSGYYGKTAIVDDYTLHETSFKGYGVRGFVREKPPKTDISTGQKDPKESSDVDVVCRVRGIVGGRYQQSVKSIAGRQIVLSGTYHSQEEGDEDVEATTSLGRLDEGEYSITLNVTDEDDVMPPFSATLTFVVGPTGVEMVSCDSDGGDIVFDLQGNRTVTPAGGSIYIVNGKKVLFQ